MKNQNTMFKSLHIFKIAVLVLCFGTTKAQTLYSNGKIEASNSTNTHVVKMLKDGMDYNYIVGTFTDSLHLDLAGGYTIFGIPNIKHGFIAKYDPYGAIQWGFALGGATDSLIIMDLNIDYNGDVLIGGSFYGTADFDPLGAATNLTATVGADGFFAKYNPSGNLIFANQIETTGSVGAVSTIFTDAGAYIYIGGYFDVSVDVDHTGGVTTLNAQAGIDGYASLYDPGGVLWLDSLSFSGAGNEYVTDITNMNFGSWLLVTGYFDADVEMNAGGSSTVLNTNGSKDIFIGRYNSAFDFQIAQNFGGAGNDVPRDVYGNSFDLVLLAQYENAVEFNPVGLPSTILTSTGLEDVVAAKYDFVFQNLWAKSFGNANNNRATILLRETSFGGAKSIGDLYSFAFNFTGTVDLDPGAGTVAATNTNTAFNTAMVTLYDDGNYQSSFVVEANSIDGMTFSGNNVRDVTLVGNFSGSNVDILPYGSTALVTHSVNEAGFYTFYNRCHIAVDGNLLGAYECGTASAILTCETTGETGAVDYNWSNGDYYEYSQTAGGAYSDNDNYFSISVSDEAGCNAQDSVWIYGHNPGFELGANVTPLPTTCGNNYGSASATPVNALGAVSYYWSNGDTTNVADSLTATTYFVQVADSLNCFVEVSFIIDNSDGPSITIDSSANPACGGLTTGLINITVTGGAAPYTFLWSNGATTEDLSGVPAGTYSLIVTDNGGCENQVCLTLTAPQAMYVGLNAQIYANCLVNDGALEVYAYGGFTPYTYQWDAAAFSQTTDSAVGLYSGMYTVTVTDSIGCTVTGTFGTGDFTGPSPYLWSSANPTCTGATGYIDIDVFGSGPFSYQWSSGQTVEDIYNIPGGDYVCIVTDAFGCKGVYSGSLYQTVPFSPNLCMVTVDSTGTQNVVVWDKSMNPEADYFNIYREGLCNSYDFGKVGFTDYDSLSVFYDTVVNTDTRSWRYYVTCVDTCGFESYPSEINRTVHLTVAFNSNYDAVLNWGAYEGYTVEDYAVYRKNPAGTAYDFVDSVSNTTFTYVDTINFSAYPSEVEYYVEARTSTVCFASRAFNQNSSRSNNAKALVVVDTTGSAINTLIEMPEDIRIYPNPTNDVVNIRIDGGDGKAYHMDVIDQLGKVVKTIDMLNRTSFTTREMNNGIYFLRIKNESGMSKTFKLIVSH
jgi:Secretion system C-terminal sorting domain/SprB repeat